MSSSFNELTRRGGIKEKVMAARRANVRVLVLPAANRKDFEELPGHLTDGMYT